MNLCKHVFIMNIQIYVYIHTVCITYIIVTSGFHVYIYIYTPSCIHCHLLGAKYRTAFRRLALLVHPDKNPGEEEFSPPKNGLPPVTEQLEGSF